MDSLQQPVAVSFDQGTTVAGGITQARDGLAFYQRVRRPGLDHRPATDRIPNAGDGLAIDAGIAGTGGYVAWAMDWATVLMAQQDDGFHRRFPWVESGLAGSEQLMAPSSIPGPYRRAS